MGRRARGGGGGVGSDTDRPTGWAGVARFEGLLAVLAAAAVWAVLLQAAGAADVLQRPLWLDEALGYRLASDPSPSHAMRALAGGCDTHPPTYYWLLRGVTAVFGVARFPVRAVSIASAAAAVGVFYLAMRAPAGRIGAATGAVAVLVNPVVLAQSTEARMYAPMLLFSVVLAALVGAERIGRWRMAAIAAAAALLCSVHYFGILAWGLILGGRVIASRDGVRRLWPALAGPVALAACVPVLLGQRRAVGNASWIEPLTVAAAGRFVAQGVPSAVAAVAATLAVVAVARMRRDRGLPPAPPDGGRGVLGACFGLLALPVVLLAFSLVVQPAYLGRYAIPAAAGAGAAVAVLARRAGRPAGVLACVVLLGWGAWRTRGWAVVPRSAGFRALEIGEALDAVPDVPVVLPSLDDEETLRLLVPEYAARLRFLDARGTLDDRITAFNRGMAANLARWYPDQIHPLPLAAAAALPRFVYVPVGAADDPAKLFPDRSATALNQFTFLVERR